MKKSKLMQIGAVCGIIGGIGLICSAIIYDNIPIIIRIMIAVCEIIMAISLFYNYKENK
ncbi:MAG: hypothetical protein K2K91_07310 [Ruminococcus sp.]|nr:hypothetical protein [Ruminococcus sp.]MDE7099347.1 hypothetical protein [Ruminococcus sp.]